MRERGRQRGRMCVYVLMCMGICVCISMNISVRLCICLCARVVLCPCVSVCVSVCARVSASTSDFCIERRAHPAFVCLLSDGSPLWRSRDFSFHINVSTKRLLRKITSATRLLVTRPWNYYTCLRSDFTPLSIVRHCVGKCYMLVITCRKCV